MEGEGFPFIQMIDTVLAERVLPYLLGHLASGFNTSLGYHCALYSNLLWASTSPEEEKEKSPTLLPQTEQA